MMERGVALDPGQCIEPLAVDRPRAAEHNRALIEGQVSRDRVEKVGRHGHDLSWRHGR
jgi:hypothetical protein